MLHLNYAERTELDLLAALKDYNRLYPDVPIAHLGDTPDRIWHLLNWDQWRDGLSPLTEDQIAAIEWRTDGSVFS